MEEKKEVIYTLLKHQENAVKNINRNYSSNHNVSGAVMPTGTGKSFVAMAMMLSINNPNYPSINENASIRVPVDENGLINSSKIVYVSPTNEIAEQIKIDIVKYICGINPDAISLQERDNLVKKTFPNLSFKCYATLAAGLKNHGNNKSSGYDPYLDEPDLVILDEVHRSGAEKYQEGTCALLGCKVENNEVVVDPNAINRKKNIKVLSISATPERDVDSRDMTKVWSKALGNYADIELSDSRRSDLGIKMTLPDAINNGILRNSNVVHFDCNLVDTDDYKTLVRLADTSIDVNLRDMARNSLQKINSSILGIGKYNPTFQELEEARAEKQIEILAESIKNGSFNKNGKFILFAPKNTPKNNPDNHTDFLKYHSEKTINILRKAFERAGAPLDEKDLKVDFISSEQDDETNKRILSEFDKKDVTSGPIHIVIAQEKFNEGVHAKNISGGFFTRSITEQENTTLRAQSILFLQQKGRFDSALIPGKEPPPLPTIFDICNNFYIQNINGSVDPEQRIEIFELTETQKLLRDSYLQAVSLLPEKADITVKLPELLQVTNILNKYNIKIDSQNIPAKTTLLKLLGRQDFDDVKDKIIDELQNIGMLQKDEMGKIKDYKLSIILQEARDAFWKGTKIFGNYSFKELLSSGIIDKTSKEYNNARGKGHIDKDGFIVMGVAKELINLNVNTGTEYSVTGKDFDGFFADQFDPETGLDENGYNRLGFNKYGIHKDTKTIHNNNGFMANGINILTGTELDLNGYNIDGIKRFYDKNKKLVGGFDKQHHFHRYDETSESFCKTPEGNLAPFDGSTNIDDLGFKSGKNKNVFTGSKLTSGGFFNNGFHHSTGERFDSENYDVYGYDKQGFNINGIHYETGTRFDTKGRQASFYSSKAVAVRKFIKNESSYTIDNGKFIRNSDGKTSLLINGFLVNGINCITGTIYDPYGLTFLNYKSDKHRDERNEYGFTAGEIKNISMASELKPGAKNSIYKYYGRIIRNDTLINPLGTDKSGHILDKNTGKVSEQLHPSLKITSDYIKQCIYGDNDLDEFIKNYAINHKLLYNEAKRAINTAVTQSFTLYRICPELAKLQEAKTVVQMLSSASPDKQLEFWKKIPSVKNTMLKDYKDLNDAIKQLHIQMSQETNKGKKAILQEKISDLEQRNTELDILKKTYKEGR